MRPLLSGLLCFALAGSFVAVGVLDHTRRVRTREVTELRREHARSSSSTTPRDEAPALSAATGAPLASLAAEVAAARREIAALEQSAQRRRAEIVAASVRRIADAAGESTRDPTQGMMKLEYFQNVGRATPAAALQTLAWAALKGEETLLTGGLALDDKARARASELAAKLPEAARAQAMPEKLGALWFMNAVLEVPAIHIFGQTAIDDDHVVLLVRGGIGDQEKLTLVRAPGGWQIVVPARGMEVLQKKVANAAPETPSP